MKELLKNKTKLSLTLLIIVYAVGAIGLLTPLKNFVAPLTPLTLLLSFGVLLYNHHQPNAKLWWVLSGVFLAGFGVEVLGVNTGFPFGVYSYGENLGPKIWGTPLIIGLNWALLIYCTAGLMVVHINPFIQALVGAAFMVLFDLALEPAAIELGFWSWQTANIPFSNYLAWFVIAYVMHIVFWRFIGKPQNKTGKWLYFIQLIFFSIINFT